ncbi:hypothetical protein BC829DRAFT_242135 [Chytridium lagenaria]|nr:hypothetical protein BC829DRAFT_242135 [Chytridium lagenaria]
MLASFFCRCSQAVVAGRRQGRNITTARGSLDELWSKHVGMRKLSLLKSQPSDYFSSLIEKISLKRHSKRLPMALSVFSDMKAYGHRPTPSVYASLMNAYVKSSKHAEARKVFDGMLKKGIKPTLLAFNALLGCELKDRNVEAALKVVEQMGVCHLTPNYETYSQLARIYIAVGDGNRAINYIDLMISNYLGKVKKANIEDNELASVISLMEVLILKSLRQNLMETAVLITGRLCLLEVSMDEPLARLSRLLRAFAEKGDVENTVLIKNAISSLISAKESVWVQMSLAYAAGGDIDAAISYLESGFSQGSIASEKDIQAIIRVLSINSPKHLLRLFKYLKTKDTHFSFETLKILDRAFQSTGDLQGLDLIISEASHLKLSDDIALCEYLLSLSLRAGNWGAMKTSYVRLKSNGSVSLAALEHMLMGAYSARDWPTLLSILQSCKTSRPPSPLDFMPFIIKISLDKLIEVSDFTQIRSVLAAAASLGLSCTTYKTVLNSSIGIIQAAKAKDHGSALSSYRYLKKQGLHPTPHAVNTFMISCCTVGDSDLILEVLNDSVKWSNSKINGPKTVMESTHDEQTSVTFLNSPTVENIAFRCINAGDYELLKKVLRLSMQLNVYLDSRKLNTVLHVFLKADMADAAIKGY